MTERNPAGPDLVDRSVAEPETPATKLDVLTVDEAAELLRIGRNQLYELIGRCEIPHRRIGRTIRLSRAAVTRWLECRDD